MVGYNTFRKRRGLTCLVIFSTMSLFHSLTASAAQIASVTTNPVSAQESKAGKDVGLIENNAVYLHVDRAKIIKLPREARTIVIGNPMIADIGNMSNDMGVLTAKAYGSTNMIILDENGVVVAEAVINVVASGENIVVVQRGLDRETYSCQPDCQPILRLGDGQTFFAKARGQITGRNALSTPK